MPELETRVANIEEHIELLERRVEQIHEMLSVRREGDERITELRFQGVRETRA